jgi:hypothetical protein
MLGNDTAIVEKLADGHSDVFTPRRTLRFTQIAAIRLTGAPSGSERLCYQWSRAEPKGQTGALSGAQFGEEFGEVLR